MHLCGSRTTPDETDDRVQKSAHVHPLMKASYIRTSTVRVHHSLLHVISSPVPFTLLANQANAKAVAGGNAGSRLAENIDKKVMTGWLYK